MQIDPARLSHIVSSGVEQVGGPAATPAAGAAEAPAAAESVAGADRLALSQQAAEVKAAHEALAALPDTRADLVAELKSQIEAGTYQANAEVIAEKLIP